MRPLGVLAILAGLVLLVFGIWSVTFESRDVDRTALVVLGTILILLGLGLVLGGWRLVRPQK